MTTPASILVVATKGTKSNEETRILTLLQGLPVETFAFDHRHRLKSALQFSLKLLESRPALVVMEGSGIGGGIPLLLAHFILGTRFVVSSGDAIAPFLAQRFPAGTWLFHAYEFALYRFAAGFIGWTPYLAGRALTAGVNRAMHAPGWSDLVFPSGRSETRKSVRQKLNIPETAIVAGIAGSLAWNSRVAYCYGLELVEAVNHAPQEDFHVIIMGDGDGINLLRQRVHPENQDRVHFTGFLPYNELAQHLLALDYGLLPQSTDAVGAYRYTTKLPEYLAAGIPILTNRIPAAYDLDSGWITRLPGENPWDKRFTQALANFLSQADRKAAAAQSAAALAAATGFSKESQAKRVHAFVQDLLENH